MEKLTLESLPAFTYQLGKKLDNLEKLLLIQSDQKQTVQTEIWFDLNELVQYDPEKRSKPTFYGYISKNLIPYHKRGKKVTFLKSEIDNWLKAGRKLTNDEIGENVNNYLSNAKRLKS